LLDGHVGRQGVGHCSLHCFGVRPVIRRRFRAKTR
jgi:hypothetical protein